MFWLRCVCSLSSVTQGREDEILAGLFWLVSWCGAVWSILRTYNRFERDTS